MTLDQVLDRTILIHARPAFVFSFFTDPARWAAWWGIGSTIDAKPGGAIRICYPNGVVAEGRVLEVAPDERVVFSFGFPGGKPVDEAHSRVTVHLRPVPQGTEVSLRHAFADATVRDQFVAGWRYQLALFSQAVATARQADVTTAVDQWFAAWAEADATRRLDALTRLCAPRVTFRDRHGLVDGVAELSEHIAAAQHFMPGLTLARQGEPRPCHGWSLVDWRAVTPTGEMRASGSDVFLFDADGRIEAVSGFWQ